jgi:hypothetical protein
LLSSEKQPRDELKGHCSDSLFSFLFKIIFLAGFSLEFEFRFPKNIRFKNTKNCFWYHQTVIPRYKCCEESSETSRHKQCEERRLSARNNFDNRYSKIGDTPNHEYPINQQVKHFPSNRAEPSRLIVVYNLMILG